MKVITSIAEKGGVGKTTIACIVAAGLAQAGKRVLLVGLDVQISSASRFLKQVPPESGSYKLVMGQEVTPVEGHLGVHLLTGGKQLDGADVRNLHPDDLRFALQKLSSQYDAVVVDVAPVITHLHRLALETTDIALIISDAQSDESVGGMAAVINEIAKAKERNRYVPQMVIPVVNRVNRRNGLDSQMADLVRTRYGKAHRVVEIPVSTVIAKALVKRAPERALLEDSPAREPLKELLTLLAGQLGKQEAAHG